jgi:hypothetical protein
MIFLPQDCFRDHEDHSRTAFIESIYTTSPSKYHALRVYSAEPLNLVIGTATNFFRRTNRMTDAPGALLVDIIFAAQLVDQVVELLLVRAADFLEPFIDFDRAAIILV